MNCPACYQPVTYEGFTAVGCDTRGCVNGPTGKRSQKAILEELLHALVNHWSLEPTQLQLIVHPTEKRIVLNWSNMQRAPLITHSLWVGVSAVIAAAEKELFG